LAVEVAGGELDLGGVVARGCLYCDVEDAVAYVLVDDEAAGEVCGVTGAFAKEGLRGR
jgi:hypothetical protein